MIEFVAVFLSGDGGRVLRRDYSAVDIDEATRRAIDDANGDTFGARSSWHVVCVFELSALYLVSSAIEGMI